MSISRENLALRATGLQVARQTGFCVALADLRLESGGAAALVGPSGAGKTTLLLGMLGLLKDTRCSGTLEIGGEPWPQADCRQRRQRLRAQVCVLNQDPKAALDPLARIGVQIKGAVRGDGRRHSRSALTDALAALGLENPLEMLRRYPHQLSGGQCQRILLAIALLRRPTLLCADEPTAGLDGARQEEFQKGLQVLREECGTAVLLATHDHKLVESLAAAPHCVVDGAVVPGWPRRPAWPQRRRQYQPGEVLLRCHGIGLDLGGHRVLNGIDLSLHRGELLALVGPSGAGKTSLAKVIAGHLAADRGKLELAVAKRAVQLLYQDAFASMTPHLSVAAQVEEIAREPFNLRSEADALYLQHQRLEHRPAFLSGGERRRSALLRALAVAPEILILDEPTASLDRNTATAVIETLLQLQARRDMSMILISHDMELAKAVADRVLVISGGRL